MTLKRLYHVFMKHLALLLCLLPLPAFAVTLADCDRESYEILIRNGSTQRVAPLSRMGGEIEEFGPVPLVSFQILSKDGKKPDHEQPIITATDPSEEFCIWSGHIDVQRLDTSGTAPGSTSSMR
jgi:hypothetical protein